MLSIKEIDDIPDKISKKWKISMKYLENIPVYPRMWPHHNFFLWTFLELLSFSSKTLCLRAFSYANLMISQFARLKFLIFDHLK